MVSMAGHDSGQHGRVLLVCVCGHVHMDVFVCDISWLRCVCAFQICVHRRKSSA